MKRRVSPEGLTGGGKEMKLSGRLETLEPIPLVLDAT
jgi:hypothetical protein